MSDKLKELIYDIRNSRTTDEIEKLIQDYVKLVRNLLEAQMIILRAENNKLWSDVQDLENEIERLNSDLDGSENECSQLESELCGLESQIEDLQWEVQNAKANGCCCGGCC